MISEDDKKGNLKKLFLHSSIYIVSDLINKSVPFFLLPVLTYYLNPSGYGILSNFNVLYSIILILIGFSAHGVINIKFHTWTKRKFSQLIGNIILILIASFVIMLLLVFLFSKQIQSVTGLNYQWQYFTVVAALFQFLGILTLNIYRLEERPVQVVKLELIQTGLNLLLTIVFVIVLTLNWQGRVGAIGLSYIIFGVLCFRIIWKLQYISFRFSPMMIKLILAFGIPLIPHALAGWIKFGLDRILITKYFGESVTGVYSAALQLSLVLYFLTMAINKAFVPYLFKKLKNPSIQSKRGLVKLTYIYFLSLPIFGLLIYLGETIVVDYLLDDSYSGVNEFLPLLILSQVFFGMYLGVVNYIFYANKNGPLAIITILSALLHVLILITLMPDYGPIVAALSLVITNFITFILVWILSNKLYKMPWF